MECVETFFHAIKIAQHQIHANLTVFPLLAPDRGEPDYLTLEEALGQQNVHVTEKSEQGSVPELRLINSGKSNVLIVEGEELVGAKQNRMVNLTFLVAGMSEVLIPVSCVEQGRWNYRTPDFHSGQKVMHFSLRRSHQSAMKDNIRAGRGLQADQMRVWDDIQEKSVQMSVHSPTGALTDLFEAYDNRLEEYSKAFRLVECQVGAIFAINGQVAGLDAFGHDQTFAKFFGRIIKSYALDAIDWSKQEETDRISPETTRRFLDSAAECTMEQHPSLSLGQNIQFESKDITGSGFVHEDRVIHLSVFARGDSVEAPRVGFGRFSQRRRQ